MCDINFDFYCLENGLKICLRSDNKQISYFRNIFIVSLDKTLCSGYIKFNYIRLGFLIFYIEASSY